VKVVFALLLCACCIAAGCGQSASTSSKKPSVAARRDVAERFAESIFRGRADAAIRLLVHPDDPALSSMATTAAAPWKTHHAAVRLPGTRSGRSWVFGYAGTHPQRNGGFEEVRGEIVVVVATSQSGSGVEFFTLRNKDVQFRTHHDSVLLPSNR
jgi:hypothetical protein